MSILRGIFYAPLVLAVGLTSAMAEMLGCETAAELCARELSDLGRLIRFGGRES